MVAEQLLACCRNTGLERGTGIAMFKDASACIFVWFILLHSTSHIRPSRVAHTSVRPTGPIQLVLTQLFGAWVDLWRFTAREPEPPFPYYSYGSNSMSANSGRWSLGHGTSCASTSSSFTSPFISVIWLAIIRAPYEKLKH